MSFNQELKNFQRNLSSDNDMKSDFVNIGRGDLEHDNTIRVQLPRGGGETKSSIDLRLMEELMKQQELYIKAKEKIFSLQNEVNLEEVRSRYVKLDLNNAQVKNEELTLENTSLKKENRRVRYENIFLKGFTIVVWLLTLVAFVNRHILPYFQGSYNENYDHLPFGKNHGSYTVWNTSG